MVNIRFLLDLDKNVQQDIIGHTKNHNSSKEIDISYNGDYRILLNIANKFRDIESIFCFSYQPLFQQSIQNRDKNQHSSYFHKDSKARYIWCIRY
jgi:hypothetical protein